ncbi:RNA polymerase sigma factor region1.1 domain-containing protein [Blautia sp.]|uniref:Uncharacterized protein n=1 Tax=Blautia glucerasea TaxID=536633 RepID=A0A6N2T6S2_9FIRM
MDVREFQEKLKKIQTLAKTQGNTLLAAQIREEFAESSLNHDQLAGVLKYLTGQGITIEGIGMEVSDQTEKETRKQIPLTPEEEEYLKEYMLSLPDENSFPEAEELFKGLAAGSGDAVQMLAAKYMKTAAELAVELNAEEIFLADLIQEANVSLVQALGMAGTQVRDENWLQEEIRKGILKACEEQSQRKFEDDSLVARVEKLENAVRELSEDEEDGESAFSIGELAVILDMDVEEIRDTLRLTGDDK